MRSRMRVGLKHAVLGVAAVVVLGAGLGFGSHPAAQEALESDDLEVSESELELYIEVYKAMQSDHGLTIDEALAERGQDLQKFREIEQRIQRQDALVRRVREALLEYAKARGGLVTPPGDSAAAGGR